MNAQTELHGRYRTGANWTVLLAAAALVIATPVATWWLVGDQSSAGTGLDYAVRPIELDPAVERMVGIGSVLAVVVSALVLARASRRRQLDQRWWSVLVPLLLAGLIVGAGWRVLTAGVIGANIGAGLVILFGGPAVAALLLWAVFRSVHLARSAHRGVTRSGDAA
jgi:hypothetical protein